jgi:methyl-accepting chemotaxis protein
LATTRALVPGSNLTISQEPDVPHTPIVASSGYFSALKICIATSMALLIVATLLRLPPWTAAAGGILPLIYYHVFYLTPRARHGLSQVAIDSVYYYGFLVTVAALGMSAVTLAVSQGKVPLNDIAYQFGLGLLATGYAVFARMHLTSISLLVDDASPEAVLDQYVVRCRELVTNVEMASTRFMDLSNSMMAKSEEVAETARRSTERSMLDLARVFDEQLRATLASGRAGLTEIRGLVSEVAFVEEREALVRSVKETLEVVTALNVAIGEFEKRSVAGARGAEAVAQTSNQLNDTLLAFDGNLARIGGKDGALATSTQAFAEAQAVVTEGAAKMAGAVGELADVTTTVSGMGVTFKNLKSLTLRANEQMQALADNSERLDDATHHLARAAEASTLLADGLERTSEALPSLRERVGGLDAGLESLGARAGTVAQRLEALSDPVNSAVAVSTDLRQALQAVNEILANAGSQAQALAGHTASNVESLQQAHQLSAGVETLKATVETVERLLNGLAQRCGQVGTSLDSSTASLKAAVNAGATSLEADVKRSAETARLFTERLTEVAQILIDRTNSRATA